MKLKPEVREALERFGQYDPDDKQRDSDRRMLAGEMLRLFPPGYHDEITPESLVAAGGVLAQMSEVVCFESCAEFWLSGCDIRQMHVYDNYRTTWIRIPSHLQPRNMGEVLELVDRCKGGE